LIIALAPLLTGVVQFGCRVLWARIRPYCAEGWESDWK